MIPGWLLTVVSWLAPGSRRAEWRHEWRAELAHRRDELSTARAASGTVRRDAGRALAAALSHALWLRALDWTFLMHDIRYALRLIVRRPSLAVVIVATLAIGIGGATTMFSVVNGVLLRQLPYEEPDDLVWMFGAFSATDSAAVSPADFVDYRERNTAFASIGAMMVNPSGVSVAGPTGPDRLQASRVTAGLITTLGVAPALGRDFVRDEERLSGPQAVIISHRLWRDRFASSPDAIGRGLTIDQRAHTIVGVMPAGFALPYDPWVTLSDPVDVYVPFPFDAPEAQSRRFHFLRLIGRLAPETSLAMAQEQMDVIARQLEAVYPENETWRLRLLTLHERLVGRARPALLILFASVALVLLIACGNVASLLLARSAGRQQEVVLRGALGASRRRIVRQLLVEGCVLALAGGATGIVLATWGLSLVQRYGPSSLPRLDTASVDARVIAFAVLASLASTVLFALAPALHATRDAARSSLGGRGSAGLARVRCRQTLVAAQVALSVVLLIGAGLLARSDHRLNAVDLGFRTEGVLMTPVSLPPDSYTLDDAERFYTRLVADVEAIPGVVSGALGSTLPLVGANDTTAYPEGEPPATETDQRFVQIRWIQGAYFDVVDTPVLRGRSFDDARDGPGAPPVVVISESLAAAFFPDEPAVGRRIVVGLRQPMTAEVIGVTADSLVFGQDTAPPSLLYLSARQSPSNFINVVVHADGDTGAIGASLRAKIQAIDPTLSVARLQPLQFFASEAVAPSRFRAGLGVSFAGVALLLTVIGLYGVLANAVAERQREIGIRLALGAGAGEILRMVLKGGAVLIVAGIVAGLGLAFWTSRFLTAFLFEVAAADPAVFVLVPVVLTLVALGAMVVPARRAARVDPSAALRAE